MTNDPGKEIAVLIPCHNEGRTIAKVVKDFQSQLPDAHIFVYDNCSTDDTAEQARNAGARVAYVNRKGKGYVVQKMFEDIEADLYVLVDGDDTYHADDVHRLLKPVLENKADMVVGARTENVTSESLKWLHQMGNGLFSILINSILGTKLRDLFSGYRVMTKALVKEIPLLASEFEIETELTIQTFVRGFIITEMGVGYRARPAGSVSKLRTFSDGFKILNALLSLVRDLRPLTYFGLASFVGFGASVAIFLSYPAGVSGSLDTKLLVVIAGGILFLCSVFFLLSGLVINTIVTRFREMEKVLKKIAGRVP